MGVMYSFGFPLTESHEGFVERRLPTGELSSSWTHQTREFSGYVAACDCGWHGERDYPPTDEGKDKAIDEWHERHMEPLLPSLASKAARRHVRRVVDAYVQESVDGLGEKRTATRALVVAAALQALVEEAQGRLGDQAHSARQAGAPWSAIGDALGVSRQAAHERFGGAGDAGQDAADGRGRSGSSVR